MLKLNRKTEYALLALRNMGQRERTAVTSVREIATHYNIPEMILAKVLQRLKHGAVVTSVKGSTGGYTLERGLDEVRLARVLSLFNEQTNLVDCIDEDAAVGCGCQQANHCDIRAPMESLNALIVAHLEGLTLADFFAGDLGRARPRNLSIFRELPAA